MYSLPMFADNPVIFTRSRVEPNEVSKVGILSDALLRAVGYVSSNYTISALSRDVRDRRDSIPNEKEWSDEFVKTIGPELERVPLLYASPRQVALKLQRVLEQFTKDGSTKLITPVSLETFSNGVRLEFVPKADAYK